MEQEKKCFVMMPFSSPAGYEENHFTKVYEQIIKPAIEEAGYEAYRTDENKICDSIIDKIFDGIQNCEMALCDLSGKNPNVLYELGLRQAYDKPVVLIQDERTEKIFDVSGISTVGYRSTRLYEDVLDAREKIGEAIKQTKEGKVHSVVQIVKATTAQFSPDASSQDDQLGILLQTIMTEISDLKNRTLPSTIAREGYEAYEKANLLRSDINNRTEDFIRISIEECNRQISFWENGIRSFDGDLLDEMLEKMAYLKSIIRISDCDSAGSYYKNVINLKKRVLLLKSRNKN